MGEWTKKTTSTNKRRALILSFLLLCVVNPSESSVATLDNDDIKFDAVAVEVDTDDANNKNIEQENPSSTNNNPSHEEIAEPEEIILNTNNSNDENNINNNKHLQYTPPTHFQITAHVQTNLHTGHSYFLPKESLPTSFAHLPYLECGAIGSTTEGLPLVSGVFRHVPHTAVVPKRDDMDVEWENLEGVTVDDIVQGANGEASDLGGSDMLKGDDSDSSGAGENWEGGRHPKRPSPPKYVVALSSMEITVGGNGNETQKFDAGDVIFIEDTWWGVWDDVLDNGDDDKLNENGDIVESTEETSTEQQDDDVADGDIKMKGYIMRASSESQTDLNVIMLTVPNAIHRHWKNAQHAMAMANRETQEALQRKQQSVPSQPTSNKITKDFGTRRPWWKGPTTFLHKQNSKQQQQQQSQPSSTLPTPCSLEPDPAFAHPSTSSTTLSQHFTQHFTGILRRSSNPHPSFLPHHHQDLLLPILAQTVAATVGGAMALALVLQLWQIIPGPIALGFGSACVLGFGTWGFVWLGEEILGQWELWRERRRLERMMSEGWGRGGGGGGASMMMGDVSNSVE